MTVWIHLVKRVREGLSRETKMGRDKVGNFIGGVQSAALCYRIQTHLCLAYYQLSLCCF